jgi:hypothetical protein
VKQSRVRYPRQRRGERKGGLVVLVQRYAQTLIAVVIAGGMVYGGLTHFATAGDVEQKFKTLAVENKASEYRLTRLFLMSELYRLRKERRTPDNEAQIKSLESQLQDADQRLRDIERTRSTR